jgi:hypothetical protein
MEKRKSENHNIPEIDTRNGVILALAKIFRLVSAGRMRAEKARVLCYVAGKQLEVFRDLERQGVPLEDGAEVARRFGEIIRRSGTSGSTYAELAERKVDNTPL